MTAFAILRHSKLKSFGEIGGSLSHTYRTRHTPNADIDRAHLNENQFETSEQVLDAIKARIPEKVRKDNVLCVEYLITTSPDWDGIGTSKEQQYFDDSLNFLKKTWGADNVISAHVHRDETTPHMVVYIVPLDESTGKLNCKKWLGGKEKLRQQQTNFSNEVGYLGLERGVEGSKAEHVSIKKYYASVENTLNTPEINLANLPEPGFFESKKDYAQRVVSELMPGYEAAVIKANEVDANKRELHTLREKVKDAKPYLEAIQYLPPTYKNKLDSVVKEASDRLTVLHEKQKQQDIEQYEKLKHTYYDFENYVNACISDRSNAEKDIEKREVKTEKWIDKKALTHDEVAEDQRKLGGGVYEVPDYYITPYDAKIGYEKAYKQFKQKVAQEAETADIERVVFSLKEQSTESNVINDLNDFDKYVQPVITEFKLESKQQAEQRIVEQQKEQRRDAQRAENERIQKEALEKYQTEKKAESERNRAVLKHSHNEPEKKIDRDNDFSIS
jgi:hypothetical protein